MHGKEVYMLDIPATVKEAYVAGYNLRTIEHPHKPLSTSRWYIWHIYIHQNKLYYDSTNEFLTRCICKIYT